MRDNFFDKYNVYPENQKIILEVINIMRLDGNTEGTLITYGEKLRRFFSDVQKLVAEISYDDTLNWLEEKFGERSPKTYRLNFEILKSFFKKCRRLGYIEKIPIKSWWNPKVGSSMPRYLTDKEISEVKVEVEDMSLRNRLMVELMLETGCRVSELCKIKVSNIDLDNKKLVLEGKGQKERAVELKNETVMLIRKYFDQELDICEYLFPSPKKEYLSTEAVRQVLDKLGKSLHNSRKITPHMFRHSFATQQMKRGINIDEIKADMGHSSTVTTSIYAAIPDEDFRNRYHKIMG